MHIVYLYRTFMWNLKIQRSASLFKMTLLSNDLVIHSSKWMLFRVRRGHLSALGGQLVDSRNTQYVNNNNNNNDNNYNKNINTNNNSLQWTVGLLPYASHFLKGAKIPGHWIREDEVGVLRLEYLLPWGSWETWYLCKIPQFYRPFHLDAEHNLKTLYISEVMVGLACVGTSLE